MILNVMNLLCLDFNWKMLRDKVLECTTTLLQSCVFFKLCFRTSFSRKPGYKHTGFNYCLDQVMKAKYWTRPWFSLMRDAHWWKFPSNFSLWYLDQNGVLKKSYLINSLSFYLGFFLIINTRSWRFFHSNVNPAWKSVYEYMHAH